MALFQLLNIPKSVRKVSPYISATEFENVVNNDLLCDWLSIVLPKKIDPHPLQSLFNKGIHHEAMIIEKLRKKMNLPLLKLSSLSTSREYTDLEHHSDLKMTMKAFQKGEPIIYSPYIACEKEELRGIPDLLVRSDYMKKYFNIDIPNSKQPSIFGDFYYIPIEIKYSQLHFDKSGKTLLNINRTKIYKTQLYVYSMILSYIQGVFSPCAFIIGKGEDSLINLGHIYFHTDDKEITKIFYNGIEWLRRVRKNAFEMDFCTDLLPNMKISHPLYDHEKKIVAEHYGEITEFWQCSIKHRFRLLDETNDQVYSWKDPKFDISLLDISKSYVDKVNSLIKINRGEVSPITKKISHDLYNWRVHSNEIYVDFETVGNEAENEESTIFLIGVWYKYNDTYQYKHFTANSLSCEKEIVLAFHDFWKEIGSPKIWHWYAEKTFWNRVCKKYDLNLYIEWNDLYKVFFEGNVFVKGCKNFKLKSYVNALLSLKKIKIDLPPKDCCNGLDALFLASEYYESKDLNILNSILLYNEFDCKSLFVLLDFIRKEL